MLVSAAAAARIRSGGSWGQVGCRVSDTEQVAGVVSLSVGSGPVMPVALPDRHFLAHADPRSIGRWYRVSSEVHGWWMAAASRAGAAIPADAFAAAIPTHFFRGPHIAITYTPDGEQAFPGVGVPELVAWRVDTESATPMTLEVEPDVLGMAQLLPGWPVDALASVRAIVVGVGSIGAATALSLATYGIGELVLVDPDRLLWHNLVRHIGSARDIGRLKVAALREQLRAQRPDTTVEAYPIDVVIDADQIRGLLNRTDIIVCAADGVAPRRVVSHLARRAGVDAVMACVLEDGALGEIMRLRPWPARGCLLCQRAGLVEAGALDPEPNLDAGYGAGTRHQPMTAVGGDLHLVGHLAAKTAVATMLERRGHPDQQLPGEHALVALRPRPGWAPPFDPDHAGELRWSPAWPIRPGCPTCEGP